MLEQRTARISACFILCLLLLSSCQQQPQDGDLRPNIVLLFADDLGYGDLSSYGHPTIQTPNLDRLSREGARLTSFYAAAPSCSPSRAALLTGRYPQRVGVPFVLGPDSEGGLSIGEVTLAEALKSAGYCTKAVGKWHLGHSSPDYLPLQNGFDEYYGLLYSNDMIPPWVQTDKPLRLWRDNAAIESQVDQSSLTTQYTQEAVDFINLASGPFFLYLAYSMPHVPIHTAPEFSGRSRSGLYGDVIETIDWSVGQVLGAIERRRLTDKTIAVFSSDNGPWLNMPDRMFAGGVVTPWHAGSAGPLRGAKATTWEGGQRVPGIIRWPGHIPPGTVSAEPLTTMDLYPTLLEAAQIEVEDGRDGANLLPLLTGENQALTRDFYYVVGWSVEAVRRGKWKLRVAGGVGENAEVIPQLFDLDVDPSERYDRSKDFPEVVSKLLLSLREFNDEIQQYRN